MKTLLAIAVLSILAVLPAHAAELVWDAQTITSPLTVERSATLTGTYTTVATLPTGSTSYILTPGAYGWYRVRYSGIANSAPSNVVQFSLDLYTGLVTDRLTALETRVTALEAVPVVAPPPPAPTSNLTTRQIDADHIEIVGGNCLSLRTTGTGLRRTLECVH